MDRTWQATVHGVARVGHDLVTKPPAGWYSSYQNALNIGDATQPSQSLTRGLILGAASWEKDWIFCGLLGRQWSRNSVIWLGVQDPVELLDLNEDSEDTWSFWNIYTCTRTCSHTHTYVGQDYGFPQAEESDTTERLPFHFSLSCTGEGNGNPLQCFCLENPRDGGPWWAAIYGVSQSRTQLKWLSSSSSSLTWLL